MVLAEGLAIENIGVSIGVRERVSLKEGAGVCKRSGRVNRCAHSTWARAEAVVNSGSCFVGRVLVPDGPFPFPHPSH